MIWYCFISVPYHYHLKQEPEVCCKSRNQRNRSGLAGFRCISSGSWSHPGICICFWFVIGFVIVSSIHFVSYIAREGEISWAFPVPRQEVNHTLEVNGIYSLNITHAWEIHQTLFELAGPSISKSMKGIDAWLLVLVLSGSAHHAHYLNFIWLEEA